MKTIPECRSNALARHLLALACLTAVALLAGCDQQGSAEKAGAKIDRAAETAEQKTEQTADQAKQQIDAAKESAAGQAQSAGEYVDDAAITAKVKSALLTDPLLKSARIEVTTVNGVVTLSGTVNDEPDIARAMEVAKTQRDVTGVQSNLVVGVAPDKK
jgi:hyperosmotically inducible protein